MNELEKNDDVILFIDEIHTIVGAGPNKPIENNTKKLGKNIFR